MSTTSNLSTSQLEMEAAPQENKRNQAVDIVKGFAITLVVLGHVGQGMNHRHLLQGTAYILSENFIYAFHMPAFFFVAGLFLDQSLHKRGPQRFALQKVRTILYPYLLWPSLTFLLLPWISKYMSDSPPTMIGFLQNLFLGDAGWFLYTLFFILMLALLLRRLPIWIRLFIAIPLSYFWPNIGWHLGINNIFWQYIFVVTGQLVGSQISKLDQLNKGIAALASVALFAGIAAATLHYGTTGLPKYLFIPLGLAGTAGLFFFAVSIPIPSWARAIAWFGQASIAIYLLSPYFQGTTRQILLSVFHTANIPLHIALQTTFAVIFPALIYHYRKLLHVEWFFKMPTWKNQSPVPGI